MLLLFVGCSNSQNPGITNEVVAMSASDFIQDMRPDGVILDVRTPDEYEQGHLASAQNINFLGPDFKDQVATLDKGKTYYLYCRSGNRSGQASALMQEMGFTSLVNIGGLADLEQAGAEVIR